ncbi:carbohydrate ABC transporter membrane protein 1 (CUT1 family) [Asanoa ferruginea]|uniref:Carbohydrate ABC transporter membrane protein 1 (CUT1 family) n=1 Tax=Asanoa ferruginea TaxID=53367 RepID=A0A3D9ZU97_9ACTN|nr:sugar ABC transporter permease [Asanoa ferruginea]REG00782.1 carbohydrate ABC transporter membrane protein 1 (CUT1 family) [Asanoa ferruginea]GIF47344.1 binding-protein-dependent transport system inner membrane protein [Asanoa ferruginea]
MDTLTRPGPVDSPVRAGPRRRGRHGRRLGYGMLTPSLVVLAVLIILPLAYSLVLSLFSWKLTDLNLPKPFVGFDNYTRILHDATVGRALVNTVIYVVGAISVELVLGFVVAAALFEMTRGRKLANALILLPMIIAPVVTALLWRYLLDPQFGLVTQLSDAVGLPSGIGWFGSSGLALPSLIAVDVWQWTPFVVLVMHAGMLSINEEQFEAARVDGAGHLRILRSIVLPAIVPQILLILLFRTMDTYRIFDTVFVLTKGGPGLSTETIGLYTYRTGFSYFDMGYAMALSVFILLTVLVISAFYIRLLRRREAL